MYVHLTARSRRFLFNDIALSLYAWSALRAAFPTAVAACLMGNHLHLVVWVADPTEAVTRLCRVIGGITRVARIERGWWFPLAPAQRIAGIGKLRAQVRYVVLNPCRADLVSDPLAWPWTTHRDVVGAVFEPWIDANRLAQVLGEPSLGFVDAHHRFVSNDTKVAIGGTPAPVTASTTTIASYPLASIAAAACAATRSPRAYLLARSLARRAFVLLSFDQGWTGAAQVGAACGVTPGSIRRILNEPDAALLAAARLTLADDRLRHWPV